MTSTYLTVSIPYVNADPHLGYAYELVQADIHARALRLDGVDTRFLGGTDDFSLKNVLAAEAAGIPTCEFVNNHASRFQALAEPLGLSFDDFIRTSADPRHIPAVHHLWTAAVDNGDLYKRPYEGDYCVGCERFFAPDELEDGNCPEHQRPVERVAEENWFFRLSRYQEALDKLITTETIRISPGPYRNEVLSFIRSGLEDISVSRSTERARGWGVPVPNDPGQVIYVWFDALTNYISALDFGTGSSAAYKQWWQETDERVHVIGKGILRFHAVYWPAFLASAGEPQPTHIRVHPYLTVGGLKLSKSSGTSIDPNHIAASYGTDALRWWFARDVAETSDSDFTVDRLVSRSNEDLAGGVGNVVKRITTLVHRYRDGKVPEVDAGPVEGSEDLPHRVRRLILRFELRRSTQDIVDAVGALNQDLERTEPWNLAKDPARSDDLDSILARHVSTTRLIATALEPITPNLAQTIRRQLRGPRLPPPAVAVNRLDSTANGAEAPDT